MAMEYRHTGRGLYVGQRVAVMAADNHSGGTVPLICVTIWGLPRSEYLASTVWKLNDFYGFDLGRARR